MTSPAPTISVDSTAHLHRRLETARARTDALLELVDDATLLERPIPERHRLVFYLGHLEAFDWNLLGVGGLALGPVDAGLDRLFAFGIDPVDGRLPTDRAGDWPDAARVRSYGREARRAVDACLGSPAWSSPTKPPSERGWLVEMAAEHRLMHAETLAYLLRRLPLERLRGAGAAAAEELEVGGAAPPPRSVPVPAGDVELGRARQSVAFGWDNEFGHVNEAVGEFEIDAHSVTNAAFAEFVREGGYGHRAFWSDAAWEWKQAAGLAHPIQWRRAGGGWALRTLLAEIPLPAAWPVYVSHAEASAYARWLGRALPTEAQWQRAAYGSAADARPFPWGHGAPTPGHGNFHFERHDPTPVGAHPLGASPFGVEDLLGNGWEWTSTPFAPLPGFEPHPLYPGYSADFFDGRHFVLKGGSPHTARSMLRRTFRNWFQPHYPYASTTFRTVRA